VRILILNWRDLRSPRAGGAEVLTHEVATRLVARGDEVVWFTSRPNGAPAREEVDGVSIVRRGSELTTRLFAPAFARRSYWDVVVEEINTLPYLTPLWARTRPLLFIPQLAREVWWHEAPLPLAAVGYLSEPLYLSVYRRTEAVTISRSTLGDLRRLGNRAPIHVIPMASSAPALPALPEKEPRGRLLIIGRLVPSKRVDHAIRALAELRRTHGSATLAIVGDGPERGSLERLAAELGVREAVEFAGRVSEEGKLALLQDADLVVACSIREGWGLTVTEAARLGTPSVGYRIHGLRDSVVDGRTGLLTESAPAALAAGVLRLLDDHALYTRLRHHAWQHAAELSWDRTASAFATVLDLHARAPAAQPSRSVFEKSGSVAMRSDET
jgi:glycosyltransferase involved in cell wall biosynthesis